MPKKKKKLNIDNTVKKNKAQYIYDTYFNPLSEHCLDNNLFDTLKNYGVIDEKECIKLEKQFEVMAHNLLHEMLCYDKNLLEKNNKK